MTFGAFQIDIVAYGESAGASDTGRPLAPPTATFRFEGEFRLVDREGGAVVLDPQTHEWAEFTPLFALRHDRVAMAVATADGRLTVSFESGLGLLADANPAYENWEVGGPGFRVIATPGGGVAIFSDVDG